MIYTGLNLYSDAGEACAGSELKIVVIDKSFADIGGMMKRIFISQCVLLCFYFGCMAMLCCDDFTPIDSNVKPDDAAE